MSSIRKFPPAYSITDRRSSPYFCFTSSNSSLMMAILRSFFSRISFKSAIVVTRASYSDRSLSCSKPVSWRKRISTIALACNSLSLKVSISFCRASSALSEARISRITSSILSDAIMRPSSMWARSSAFFSSNWVLRTTTSWRCSTKWWIICFRFSNSGLPLTSAILLTEKEDWRAVNL